MKCPYHFPARSREAMISAMESIGGYSGWNAPNRRAYPFAWNVKLPYIRNAEKAETLNPFHYDGGAFNPAWDSDWESHTQGDYFETGIIEAMRSGVDDYSTWPGDDGGAYEFEFAGRSGGWLVLTGWHGRDMAGLDLDELRVPEEEGGWSFASVRQLYKAVTCMDSDFSDEAVRQELLSQLAFARTQWEEERREEIEQAKAEAETDESTARQLIAELREARRSMPASFPVICRTIRQAIRSALADRRESRRLVAELESGHVC